MVYLVIKELSKIAEDVIMVTSSIMKDMQPNLEVIYRPNAIRALARIIDVSPHCSCQLHALTSRLNPSNLSNDTSSPLLLTVPHLSLPPRSSRRTTSSTYLPPLSSDGQTKLKRQSTPRPSLHLHSLALHRISRVVDREDTRPSPRPATLCSTTLWVCCT